MKKQKIFAIGNSTNYTFVVLFDQTLEEVFDICNRVIEKKIRNRGTQKMNRPNRRITKKPHTFREITQNHLLQI